jgi:hypothetical protein
MISLYNFYQYPKYQNVMPDPLGCKYLQWKGQLLFQCVIEAFLSSPFCKYGHPKEAAPSYTRFL